MPVQDFRGNNDDQNNNAVPVGPGSGGGPTLLNPPVANDPHEETRKLLINYNRKFKKASPTLHRDAVIEQTMGVLIGKDKPNPLLLGGAGVGKTRVVEEIARLITLKDPRVPAPLRKNKIYELPLASLMAGTMYRGMMEEKVQGLIDFATDKDERAIIFIDEIHLLFSGAGVGGSFYGEIAQMLKPAMARGEMKLIGSTTRQEARGIDSDPAFARRCNKVSIPELTKEQTFEVMKAAFSSYNDHYKNKVSINDDIMREIIEQSTAYHKVGQHRPDTALTLMDRCMAETVMKYTAATQAAQATQNKVALAAMNASLNWPLNSRTVQEMAQRMARGSSVKPSGNVSSVRTELNKRLLGQNDVLDGVVDVLERDQLSITHRSKPLAWIFAGPSGTGKTETAKIIAQELTNEPPIILAMNEYSSPYSQTRLFGADPGYIGSTSNQEKPFDPLEDNPYRVILLDEIEKAHTDIQRMFLSVLDEGVFTPASGSPIDMSRAIIIATTNAARDINGAGLGFGNSATNGPAAHKATRGTLIKALEKNFDPEFIARFTDVVAFNGLNDDIYGQIIALAYDMLRDNASSRHQNKLPAEIPQDHLAALVKATYVYSQGARPAHRAAQTYAENILLGRTDPAAV